MSNNAYGLYGGISSVGASIITHPLDMIRIQMQAQIRTLTMSSATQLILKYGGKTGLYYGFRSLVIRNLSHGVMRFGIYEEATHRGKISNFYSRVYIGAGSGFVAGFVNTPLERIGVHMRTDVTRLPRCRRNYKSTLDGLTQLYMVGGLRNLYAFAISSAIRSMFFTVGQISIYEEVKEKFGTEENFGIENFQNFFLASMSASTIASIITLPMDVVKTIGMNAEYSHYRGSWHVANSILKAHGAKGFCKGFVPSFMRLWPQTILTYFFYENLRLYFS